MISSVENLQLNVRNSNFRRTIVVSVRKVQISAPATFF